MITNYQKSIQDLYQKRKFISLDSDLLEHDFQTILSTLDKDEFFLQCNLNPSDTYNQTVFRACRKASMYVLYSVTHKLTMGKFLLKHIQVCEGFVGDTPHTWLLLGNKYYVDLTLAQFTPLSIPELAVLSVEDNDVQSIYQTKHVFSWQDWVELEAESSI